ncbi:MAG: response regulator [Candidatus Omnitrophota bacterium]
MNPKVMIVDDEPEVCEAIDRFLSRRGFSVVTARDGEEALCKVINERPELVFLDIRLPGVDGVECLRRIKQICPQTLVVMVTCVNDLDIAEEAIQLGAIDYITKPCEMEVIEKLATVYLFLHSEA